MAAMIDMLRIDRDRERRRLEVLHGLGILDSEREPEFETVAAVARRVMDCPIALVSLVDRERQWFKAGCGIDVRETPLEHSFCAVAVAAEASLIVEDALEDDRFRTMAPVAGPPFVRFYAGIPLRLAMEGERPVCLGTLCVIDTVPHSPSREDLAMLTELTGVVEALIRTRVATRRAESLAAEHRSDIRQLRRAHRQFRQAERIANIGSWRLALDDMSIEWSEQTSAIHGLPAGKAPSMERALSFYPQQSRGVVTAAMERAIASGEPFDLEVDFHDANGVKRRVHTMGEVEYEGDRATALTGVFQDVTVRHRLEQSLRRMARTDELTGLANRAALNRVLEERMAVARRTGDALALLLIDLDGFKQVNDRCGHLAGDEVLRLFGSRLQAIADGGSFAARLGGDEFVLVVERRDEGEVGVLVRQLLDALRHEVPLTDATLLVSASIGVAWLGDDVADRSSLLHRADVALYEAKRERGTARAYCG